ncbi:MAG: ATP-binding cassette domain-containing protein, partial [Desulfovibrio sp.]|nr:ATP-binding cassette domain-containing protein [Desulfovibrio sp.]
MYVELKKINKYFKEFQAARDVSFDIGQGILAALLGPSGSGKTTVLRMIAGLEHPDSGDIFIAGTRVNEVEAGRRGIGFVFQNYALFRYMNVFDNIAFGLSVKKERPAAIKGRVAELLELIGMEGMEKRYPAQLSGGQKQRVAFA